MTADIREMFPQVKIRVEDRDALRFLWRDNPKEPLKTYRMSSMIFGAASSPCTALYVKDKNAEQCKDLYPEAVTAILEDHYMDDYIGSVASVEKAAQLAIDVVTIHRRAGFEMRSWVSNEPRALAQLPRDLLLSQSVANIALGDFPTSVRSLGLVWKPESDVITFNPTISDKSIFKESLTKRKLLSYIMRVYDPLGILAPIIVPGRIMFQRVWRKGYEWDEKLPEIEQKVWKSWFDILTTVSNLKIPRLYYFGIGEFNECELHIFADASESAFVAVAYWRFLYNDGKVKLSLVGSKARVAPLKPVSIPRLELQGALLAARLASSICENHRYTPSRRYFWSDSLNVLGWLRSDARSYKPFVAHRVGEIIELTNVEEWRWVPTDFNVADDATRVKCNELTVDSRWITGPGFLLTNDWPVEPAHRTSSLQEELKSSVSSFRIRRNMVAVVADQASSHNSLTSLLHQSVESVQLRLPLCADSTRISSWLTLVRATARAHKFLIFIRSGALRKKGVPEDTINSSITTLMAFTSGIESGSVCRILTAEDVRRAEVHIFRRSQLDSFEKELVCLRNGKPLPPQSRLNKFVVFLDKDGLIKLSDRTATRRPIVIDSKQTACRLLLEHHHVRAAHGNNEMVVSRLRLNFWILGIRNALRSIVHNCIICKQLRAKPLCPPTGDLPPERLAYHQRPFSYVGLDYFGPLMVAVGRRQEKRYVAVLTCLVTRALHLEIVHSLSTDGALMCLRRFIARRGIPCEIMSDNGTAFIGANRELKSLYGAAIQDFVANEKINWKFIPPSAPFMGGAWERMVKSVKTALRVTLKQRTPSDEVLATLLAEAEALVNSRPLTHIPCEPDAEEPLTPYHFLIGSSMGRTFPAHLEDRDLVSRSSWKKALRLADHFWRRWLQEYMLILVPRKNERAVPTKNVAVGDLVLVVDGNLLRGTWPRGKVSAIYPGHDGIVRVADVCTSAGILRRPAKKLVVLT